ncbi:hypothetical protein QWZ16_24520 [Vibrio ostreicida]|uniref:Uncharacterized protein n=1 Tax=Vibrio ostreicida TaxID=526588 RepID=A0ABT8C1C0_9VIBR|nr:hypothetical protein [Vibrio ostreicida]MDN3610051.1 hypothetical protein [Vibrio ostreicida]MDN3612733.1 hypothetical protein [Vibrio ostreicida]
MTLSCDTVQISQNQASLYLRISVIHWAYSGPTNDYFRDKNIEIDWSEQNPILGDFELFPQENN